MENNMNPEELLKIEGRIELIWERAHIPAFANDAKIVIKQLFRAKLQEAHEASAADMKESLCKIVDKWHIKKGGYTQMAHVLRETPLTKNIWSKKNL